MQKSPNRANTRPWHGYTCMCCSGWSALSRAQLKKDAEKEIEEGLVDQLAESLLLKSRKCEFESHRG